MFDKYIIVGDDFKNVKDNGTATGFQIGERLPYYRGVFLALVRPVELTVDGERFSPDQITVTLHGNTYPLTQLPSITNDRWEFGEVGILTVQKPGGLQPGEHRVEVTQPLDIAYVPSGFFVGRDEKVLELKG